MYDGRNRAQNGWFVLRTLIPAGKTEGAVVWHIRPDVIPNWTRPPMIAHSQVGYAPDFPKVAVIELDPKFNAPKTAKVLRLVEDGSYKQVFEGPVSAVDALAALQLCEVRLLVGEGSGPVRDRVRGSAHRRRSPSPRMSTARPGSPAWTASSPWRWITSPCAKATGCGTAFRTSTTRARRRRMAALRRLPHQARTSIRPSSPASTFPA